MQGYNNWNFGMHNTNITWYNLNQNIPKRISNAQELYETHCNKRQTNILIDKRLGIIEIMENNFIIHPIEHLKRKKGKSEEFLASFVI